MRGEHMSIAFMRSPGSGSPPHARGTREKTGITVPEDRITPACAGNTRKTESIQPLHQDHPRMRGEHTLSLSPGF